jgi:glycine cleavage system aminomethyltransferase T
MKNSWKSPLQDQYGKGAMLGYNDGCEVAKAFSGAEVEYEAVRHSVAISDSSHYGKFRVSGSEALECVNKTVMADISRLAIGRATWTFALRDDGSILCDVYVACMGDEYIVLSEGAVPADVLPVLEEAATEYSARVDDMTASSVLIGLDGPYCWELLKEIVGVRILGLRYLECLEDVGIGESSVFLIRAGKSGEFGYMLVVSADEAAAVWRHVLNRGQAFGAQAVGYETLDLCRLENRFINIHREAAAAKNPMELNCRVMLDREKESYNGSEAVDEALRQPLENRIIGMTINAGITPELGAEVKLGSEACGRVVNAGFSPTLGKPIALVLMAADKAYVGLDFDVQLPSGSAGAKTVSAPFIRNASMTVRPQEDSYRKR